MMPWPQSYPADPLVIAAGVAGFLLTDTSWQELLPRLVEVVTT